MFVITELLEGETLRARIQHGPMPVRKATDIAMLRVDFAAGAGRFFFTLEDRQADIWMADITRRSQ